MERKPIIITKEMLENAEKEDGLYALYVYEDIDLPLLMEEEIVEHYREQLEAQGQIIL
ncbi:MAG: hypothetical protein ACK5HL_04345 [Bacilli bacterium]